MTTVADVNKAFSEKRMTIQLPYPEEWQVRDVQILEKRDTARHVQVLLAVELVREGKVFRDICYLEGDIDRGDTRPEAQEEGVPKRTRALPVRDRFDFDSDAEALGHITDAFSALLLDHDYRIERHPEVDLYGCVGQRGFFVMCACRFDQDATEKARRLIDLRKRQKHGHDYGLAVPAFQEPFGIPFSVQESWVAAHADILCTHRVGLYGVDNADPNRIYPFTVYPQVRGLLRYFVATSRQWQDVRQRYLMARKCDPHTGRRRER
jgi:hypothetical protein